MNILTFIENLRETDPYIETIYMQGGCYKFHLFLKKYWPRAIPVTNAQRDHVASLIDGAAYDIKGLIDWSYIAMDCDDISDAEKWSFTDNAFLQIGECPVCDEPLVI